MSDYPIPIIQWIQNLKHNLHFLLLSCGQNSAYIHACKFAEVGTYLLKFLETIDKYSSLRDSTPEENENFRNLLKLIEDMTTYVKSYHKENYLETILNNGVNDISNEIKNFRENFNKLCLSLNMTDSNKKPYYPNNPIQFNYNDIEDCKNLIKILNSIIEGPNQIITDEEDIKKIRHKILELETIVSEKNVLFLTSYQNQILSKEEVSQQLDMYKDWEVSVPEDFYIKNKTVVGHGGFSTVYLGGQISTNKIVAIKQYLRTEFTSKDLEMYKREISTYLFLQTPTKHPCLLTFIGATTKPPYCILTEYMSGQSLYVRLHNRGLKYEPLSATSKTIIAVGIAHGMEYLHSKGLIHRDLKSLNVLLDSNDYPRICDFGLSRSQGTDSEIMTKGVGTFRWMAPEVFQSNHYNSKVDVYSFAILLWEMLTEKIPFIDDLDNNAHRMNQIDNRPKIPDDCPPNLASFITACWDKDPEHRPDFKSIVKVFDEGEFEFPGTERNKVEEYIKTIIIPSDPMKLIESLVKEINNEKNRKKLNEVIEKVDEKNLTNSISIILENNEEHKKTNYFLKLCFECRPDFIQCLKPSYGQFINYFKKNIDTELITLIHKILINNSDSSLFLSSDELHSIAQFMNETEIDQDSLNLLHLIATKKEFKSMDDFVSIVPDLLITLQIAEDEKKFLSILSLFEKIMNFNGFVTSIVNCNGQILLSTALLRNSKIPLKLLSFILENSMPTVQCSEFIFLFLRNFDLSDEENAINALRMIKSLLKLDCSFHLFAKIPQNPLSLFLSSDVSDEVKKIALKISFVLLNNPETFSVVFEKVDSIICLLLTDNKDVKLLALLCLTQLPSNCISTKLCCDTVFKFFKNTFNLNFLNDSEKVDETAISFNLKIIEFSLRLCGIMTETKEGAAFVLKFIEDLIPFLQIKDEKDDDDYNNYNSSSSLNEQKEKVRMFACILFACFSSYNQTLDVFENCIDSMMKIAENCEYKKYPLAFLSNISSNVDFAIKTSFHMEKLINLMNSGVNEAFSVIWRISTTPETFEYWSTAEINNNKNNNNENENDVGCEGEGLEISVMQKMVRCVLEFADCELHELIVDIFQSISLCKEGKKSMKNEKVDIYLNGKLNEAADDDLLRSVYVKILSRLKNV